jgi:hypothetical protein
LSLVVVGGSPSELLFTTQPDPKSPQWPPISPPTSDSQQSRRQADQQPPTPPSGTRPPSDNGGDKKPLIKGAFSQFYASRCKPMPDWLLKISGTKSFPLDGQWAWFRIVVTGLSACTPSPYQLRYHQGKSTGFVDSI